jgi:hypothetical protein
MAGRGVGVAFLLVTLVTLFVVSVSASAQDAQGTRQTGDARLAAPPNPAQPLVLGGPMRTTGDQSGYPEGAATVPAPSGQAAAGRWVWNPPTGTWYWAVVAPPPASYYVYPYYPDSHPYPRWWYWCPPPAQKWTFVPNPDFEKGLFGMFEPPKPPKMAFPPGYSPAFPWNRPTTTPDQPTIQHQPEQTQRPRTVQRSTQQPSSRSAPRRLSQTPSEQPAE